MTADKTGWQFQFIAYLV